MGLQAEDQGDVLREGWTRSETSDEVSSVSLSFPLCVKSMSIMTAGQSPHRVLKVTET